MLSRQIRNQKPKYRLAHKDSRFENDKIESQPIRNPQNIRVVQSHLVYVIGLKPSICDENTLVSKEYFGKYGSVNKVVINKRGSSNRKYYKDLSYAAHITYDDQISASLAVISLFEFKYHEFIMRSCYGYTKYCDNFYYGRDCYKSDCVYLHEFQSQQQIVAGEGCDKQRERLNFQKQLHLALKIVYRNRKQVIQNWREEKQITDEFPDPYQAMKALVVHGYMTEQQYERQWQVEDTLKCYTQSTETSPIKQQESDYQKHQTQIPPQQQNLIEDSQLEQQVQQSVSSNPVISTNSSSSSSNNSQQIDQMISKSILRVVRNKSIRRVMQIGIPNLNFSLLVPNQIKIKSLGNFLKESCYSKFDQHQINKKRYQLIFYIQYQYYFYIMEKINKGIIIVYGSPASGKTTFSNHLLHISPYKTLLINADNVELFFHHNDALQIPSVKIETSCHLFQIVQTIKEENIVFSPEIWKKSRDFIKNSIQSLMFICDILIIQDDFLLKSQRKPFKHYCAFHQINYLQIYMNTSLQQCLLLNQKRGVKIPSQILIQKHTKIQPSSYPLTLSQRNILWQWVQQHSHIPPIQLQQLSTNKHNHEQSIIQQTEHKIRKYISQIITTQLNMTLFKNLNIKQISKTLSSLKKSFDLKRGFEQFKLQVQKLSNQNKN